jgi:hypothetical protein
MFAPLPNTLVIGLGHKARHGKDTAAEWLVKMYGATRFAFSDALYAYCRVEHGMTTKDAPLLQKVGVAMRERDPLVWVKAVYYDMLTKAPKIAVITDVRFPNEMDFVKSVGGVTCKVTRYNDGGTPYVAADRDPYHISETALDEYQWDHNIRAVSGDLEHLRGEVSAMMYGVQMARKIEGEIYQASGVRYGR